MNWYKYLKLAQFINDIEDQGADFLENLEKLYELEYKLHILKNSVYSFKGLEERKNNIIKILEKQLLKIIRIVKEPIIYTFQQWLSGHAITNPYLWAQKRIEENIESDLNTEQMLQNITFEYEKYKSNKFNIPTEKVFYEMIQLALQDEEKYPSLTKLKERFSEVKQEELLNDLNSEGYEEFGEMMGESFQNLQQAQLYIENETNINNFDLSDFIYNIGIEQFINIMDYYQLNINDFLIELNQNLVFPLWYNFWKSEGIDKTRKRIENAYKKLIKAQTINDNIVAINYALNTTHQTGSMLEHLSGNINVGSSDIEEILTNLSSNNYLKKWNKDLKEIGVSIPQQRNKQLV